MAKRSVDKALSDLAAQLELTKVREEVSLALQLESRPSAYLPMARKGMLPAPHVTLRTALFSAMADQDKKGSAREFVKDKQIAGLKNMRVSFTGQLLDQLDLDVFLAVLFIASGKPLGCPIVSSGRQLLSAQKKGDDGRGYSDLQDSLKRLVGAVLDIDQGGARFVGSLLSSARRLSSGDGWTVRLDPDLIKIFGPGGFCTLNREVRAALHGKPLAKWIDGYYSSQPEAHALKVETVRKLCGSRSKNLRSFKQTLVKALTAVADARRLQGINFTWEIDSSGLLRVHR